MHTLQEEQRVKSLPVAVTMSADFPGTPRAMARDGKMMMDTMMKRRPNVEFLTRPPGNQFCGARDAVSAYQHFDSFTFAAEHYAQPETSGRMMLLLLLPLGIPSDQAICFT